MVKKNDIKDNSIQPDRTDHSLAGTILNRIKEMNILPDETIGETKEPQKVIKPLISTVPIKQSLQDFEDQKRKAWEEGYKNQAYYINQAKKSGKLWFLHPRKDIQYSEFVVINEAMANELLTKNFDNRKVSDQIVAAYARDIINDHWFPTSESIVIDTDQNFADGQHRVLAIVKSHKPCCIYVSWNVPVASKFVIDSGKRRTINEKLQMVISNQYGPKYSAVCRAMMQGMSFPRVVYSESEIAEFAIKHGETLNFILKELPTVKGVKSGVQAAVGKAALWYGKEKVQPFCDRLRRIVLEKEDDPVRLLYSFLQQKRGYRTTGLVIYAKSLSAVDHFVHNRSIRALCEKKTDLFAWGPNWSVPEDAPINFNR